MTEEVAIWIFKFFIFLTRAGAMIMLLPGFGEKYIGIKLRVVLVCFIAVILQQVVNITIPSLELIWILHGIVHEFLVGAVIAINVRLYFYLLNFVGAIIGSSSNLNMATFFDPAVNKQDIVFATMLSLFAVMAIFATETHHIFIRGIFESYEKFHVWDTVNVGDVAKLIIEAASNSFELAFKISSPFIVVNIAIQIANGVLSRLMPTLQIFFIMTPVQIIVIMWIFIIMSSLMIGKVVHILGLIMERYVL